MSTPTTPARAATLHGIRTVARLELLQRRRASRWPVVLGVWFVVVGAVTALTRAALHSGGAADPEAGPALYDITTFVVLGLGMLVVPALTATSINGDRENGVLASLQTTLLTSADIVLGKLVASWAVALVFLATALPFLGWAWVEGGLGVGQVLRSLAVLVLVLAVVCAIGLMFSTLTARPVTSAVLTYLTCAGLTVVTVLVFVLSFFLVTEHGRERYYGLPSEATMDSPASACRHLTREADVVHTERIWWLLALNPFVTVADAAPGEGDEQQAFMPMKLISSGVRAARAGAAGERDECWAAGHTPDMFSDDGPPVWPYGLAFLLAAGAGSTLVAVRRVRTPVRRLPNGTRIA